MNEKEHCESINQNPAPETAPAQTDLESPVQAVSEACLPEEPCCAHCKKPKKQCKHAQKKALAQAYRRQIAAITGQNMELLTHCAGYAANRVPSAALPLESILATVYSSSAARAAKI